MKMKCLLWGLGLLLIINLTVGEEISVSESSDQVEIKCKSAAEIKEYKFIDVNEVHTCGNSADILVRIRTCENCIELDVSTLSALVIGNILATIFVAVAIYNVSSQPQAKIFTGNKASDRVNLIQNGESDTYQHLKGDRDTYSKLEKPRH